MASNSNCREVCVEVYVNGELYCIDSVGVPDEDNVQVEFMVTDRIYEVLGCSPGDVTARLEVDTDKCISVSRAALEGEDVQIDVDVKQLTCTTPENSPTESTTEWVKRKMSGFFQTNFWMDPAVPEQTPEKDRVPEPEVNQVTVRWPAEGNRKNSPKRVMKKMCAVFKKYFPLDQAGPSCDPEPEPAEGQEVDISNGMDASPETAEMNGPRESAKKKKMSAFFKKYFPLDQNGPSCGPETEPVSAEGQEVDILNGMDASPETAEMNGPRESTKKKKMSAFFKKYFPLDQNGPSCGPETDPVSTEGQEVDIFNGMDASPETAEMNGPRESTIEWAMRKMSGFFQIIFWMDPAVPEPTPEKDRVPKPEVNLVGFSCPGSSSEIEKNSPKRESAKKKKISAFFKKYFPLDQAGPSCDPEPESAEGQEVDIFNGMDASPETAEMNGPRESTIEWAMRKMSGFFQIIFWMDPAVPEQTPEKDRVPKPEVNLVGFSCPGSSSEIEKNSPKRESTKKKKMSAFFKKYFPLDQAGPSCDPESE